MRLRDLGDAITARSKKVRGGISVDLTMLKQAGEVLNPSCGYWTHLSHGHPQSPAILRTPQRLAGHGGHGTAGT